MFVDRIVLCDDCRTPTFINDYLFRAPCSKSGCSAIVLKPVEAGLKYVRITCNNRTVYTCVDEDDSSYGCVCCDDKFAISSTVAEIRCGQKVYSTVRKNPLEEELRRLRTELFAKEEEAEAFKMEKSSLQKKVSELEEELKKAAKETNKERDHKVFILQEFNKKHADFMQTRDDLETALKERDELKQKFTEAEEAFKMDNCALKAFILELEEELKMSTEDKKKLEVDLKAINKQLDKVIDERDKLECSLKLDNIINDMENIRTNWEFEEVKTENSTLKTFIAELEEKLKASTTEIINLKNENELLDEIKDDLEEQLETIKEQLESAAEEGHELKDQLAVCEAEKKKAAEEINDLIITNRNLSESVAILTKREKKAEDKVTKLKHQMKEMEDKHNEKMKTLEGLLKGMFSDFHGHLDLVGKKIPQVKKQPEEDKVEKAKNMEKIEENQWKEDFFVVPEQKKSAKNIFLDDSLDSSEEDSDEVLNKTIDLSSIAPVAEWAEDRVKTASKDENETSLNTQAEEELMKNNFHWCEGDISASTPLMEEQEYGYEEIDDLDNSAIFTPPDSPLVPLFPDVFSRTRKTESLQESEKKALEAQILQLTEMNKMLMKKIRENEGNQ